MIKTIERICVFFAKKIGWLIAWFAIFSFTNAACYYVLKYVVSDSGYEYQIEKRINKLKVKLAGSANKVVRLKAKD